MSTSAGLAYEGERFDRYLADFGNAYHFSDMYSGGFMMMSQAPEANWAFWSRNIYINRYVTAPKPVHTELLDLVKDKDYFVLTTNVDHQFIKAGFDKDRLFYTQGDYGLWQCSTPCHERTYDNKDRVIRMLLAQGLLIGEDGALLVPEKENGQTDYSRLSMTIPSELVPLCPVCGEPMMMNLRGDDRFVENEGWHRASAAYAHFLREHETCRTLYLELGVGANTPVIIKYPFWQMTLDQPDATYACLNYGEAYAPGEIADKTILLNGDIGEILEELRSC